MTISDAIIPTGTEAGQPTQPAKRVFIGLIYRADVPADRQTVTSICEQQNVSAIIAD
ncbi:hypothetical protein [Spirosoma rhododendri]|uniref:Uncharacterized protein n=1 Tax=Spirosoma rhododendri TaxID=2728024 RepID=A0A7L5DRX5_9BACT|nr:hypothetical protein [Spirosoma rhododendri]QJD81176.1 hypothetical protein HH216_24195 [Spirosoma rhododendri]